MYWAVLGFVCEMSFRAMGMKPPGFASAAPAPTITIAGDDAILLICPNIASARFGSRGRRTSRSTQISKSAPAKMSKIATHVFGVDVWWEAALFPRTKAATMPTASVAPIAPR